MVDVGLPDDKHGENILSTCSQHFPLFSQHVVFWRVLHTAAPLQPGSQVPWCDQSK
jgi:hypothetical protein